MQLSDFFATFNLFNLSIFILAFVTFDAIGANIAYFIKPSNYLRTVYWLWGLGLFVFLWFLLHMFIPFWPQYVWISLLFCLVFSLPLYIKQKGPTSFIRELFSFPYPLFFILIAAKPLFFLLSSPPFYTDEMAYHYYSPAQLILENRWAFLSSGAPSLYQMVPKMLETSFIFMFSITKTYVTARLLHFMMVFFSLYAIAKYIGKNIGLLPAIIYSFLSLLMSASTFLASSTWGYIDAGTAILANLFLITLVDVFKNPKMTTVFVCVLTFGLAIGIKYTTLGFIGSAILIGMVLYIIMNYKKMFKALHKVKLAAIFNRLNLKFLIIFSLLIFIFGGYWYVKNYFISGNPIYPFVFQCKNAWPCGTSREYFQGWAIPLDMEHFPQVKNMIFQKNDLLFYITLFSIIIGFIVGQIYRNITLKAISIILLFAVVLEVILSKNITGFELRYYYHWVLFIPLLLVCPLGLFSKRKKIPRIVLFTTILYLLLFAYSAGSVSIKNIKRIYEPDFVPGYIRNYAMHRITLNDWIDYYFPKMNDFIKWCGVRKPMQGVMLVDPSLIWVSYEGMMRVFMVNCSLTGSGRPYIVSETRCIPGQPYVTSDPDPAIQEMHKFNQKLICGSKEILKNLYLRSEELEH